MEGVYRDVNNGVYECGFAGNQESYEDAYQRLFDRLDWLERAARRASATSWATPSPRPTSASSPPSPGSTPCTTAHFKCNRNKLAEMPVLWAYARDLFQTPGFGDTIDFDHIKRHYYEVHTDVNPTGIVPVGPDLSEWATAHGRESLGGSPFGDGTPPGPPPADERVDPAHNPLVAA